MIKKLPIISLILLVLGAGTALVVWLLSSHIAVLDPKGLIALKQRDLMVMATLLSLVVVIPVFILTFVIAWKYRAGNTRAIYTPNWDHNRMLETIWWAVPCAIIAILAVLTWSSSHELDPYRPLASSQKPIRVQVVALPWKWLFIYPDQRVASIGALQIPVNTPITFEITADAPMNSFWIPELGGQIYAMPGMSTKLHLMATSVGDYRGSSANLSGDGFAGMTFTAEARSAADFEAWVHQARQSPNRLSKSEYMVLARPSEHNPRTIYALDDTTLYDTVVMKYMSHPTLHSPNHHMMEGL